MGCEGIVFWVEVRDFEIRPKKGQGREDARARQYNTPSWVVSQKFSFPLSLLSMALAKIKPVWQKWRE